MISAIRSFFTSIWFWPMKLYALMNSPPNFSLIASTRGLDHGSCCGPFGFGGAAGAAGLAPGGGGGGLGTAAFGCSGGAAGLGGSAGFPVSWLSFCSSATLYLGRNYVICERRVTQRRGFNHIESASVNAHSPVLACAQLDIVTQR